MTIFTQNLNRKIKKSGLNIEGFSKDLNSLYSIDNAVVKDGFLVAGDVTVTDPTGPWVEMRSEDQSTDSTTDSFGLNLQYTTDSWEIALDIAHSEGEKNAKRYDCLYARLRVRYGDTGRWYAGKYMAGIKKPNLFF